MKKETFKKIGFGALVILIVAATVMSVLSFREIYGTQWTHIANACTYWAIGDEWITDNCRPEGIGENTTLICKLVIEGRDYTAPLSIINVSNVKSCRFHEKIFVHTKGPAIGIDELSSTNII